MTRFAAPIFAAPIFAALVILSGGFVAVAQVGAESHGDLSGRDDAGSADPVPTPESMAFRCWPEVRDRIEPSALLLGPLMVYRHTIIQRLARSRSSSAGSVEDTTVLP